MPRVIVTVSALFLGVLGFAFFLAPSELGALLGLASNAGGPPGPGAVGTPPGVGLQLFGGALLSVGVLDGLARGALYGGIYGRPISMGNFLLGALVASVLLREASTGPAYLLAALFAGHAAAFAWILFRARPWNTAPGPSGEGRDG